MIKLNFHWAKGDLEYGKKVAAGENVRCREGSLPIPIPLASFPSISHPEN